jgi:putative glycosyltransferase (TIGR04372 family)
MILSNLNKVFKMSFYEILSYPIGILIVFFIRSISPFVLIKFSPIRSSRIGHFAGNTELACLEIKQYLKTKSKKQIIFFYFKDKTISNLYLGKMWRRTIKVLPRNIGKSIVSINRIFKGFEKFEFYPKCEDRDVYNLLDSSPPTLKFTESEIKFGFDQLEKMGVPKNKKYVCLIVRDSAYLNSEEYAYHNYRNCNIENYILAAEWLTRNGYCVIRMGSKVERKFKSDNPHIFDYATNGFRTEFLDIFICANCFFAISTSTGLDSIPIIFRKPIVFAPFVPLAYIFTFSSNFLGITKHHFSNIKNRNLSLVEIFDLGIAGGLKSDDFSQLGVTLKENDPEEIRLVVEEMHLMLNFDLALSTIPNDFLAKYTFLIRKYKFDSLHGKIKFQISPNFLQRNEYFMED